MQNLEEIPSKSQLKRDMMELQKLGKIIAHLSLSQVKKLDLNEKLYDAIELAQNIHSNSASKRHRQYIGKLISKLDEQELEDIQNKMDALENTALESNKHFHLLEQYRDKIIKDGDSAIQDILQKYPQLERSHLRQLQRNAQKELSKEQAPKSARLIYKYLKENIRV